jgi:hypothetical protein
VQAVSVEFEDLDDLRNVMRNCDRLFPENPQKNPTTEAKNLRRKFVSLRRENEKKKLRSRRVSARSRRSLTLRQCGT